MSSSSQIVVDVSMCEVGVAPKVGYMNGSGGATPLCHVGTFSGACSNCCCSLLISLRTRRCMPLMEQGPSWNSEGVSFLIQSPCCSLGVKDLVVESY